MANDLDTSQISSWRSIVTLVVFVLTNVVVLYPFHIPIYVPRPLWGLVLDALGSLKIIPPRHGHNRYNCHGGCGSNEIGNEGKPSRFVRLNFPMDFVTAPLIADLFLLAILAIGRQEVHDGTIGTNNISPIDIMVFFITLTYIAISLDASGLIRHLAFRVLQKGGKAGQRLYFYLYVFFFVLGAFIGNDPIILSGTPFLAYMTRVSSNIAHPRAWIFAQFSVANIASAILVSSNPTNLVLAGAFDIKFVVYTANMIVPVIVTVIVLFPFLLWVVFAGEALVPRSIRMRELSEEARAKKPVNPNIPYSRGLGGTEEEEQGQDDGITADGRGKGNNKQLSLEEIMNPFLDKWSAAVGTVVMAATLITVLALNAASPTGNEHPVFWVTLPAAVVMFCWDVVWGWYHRRETREIARKGREEVERARADRAAAQREEELNREALRKEERDATTSSEQILMHPYKRSGGAQRPSGRYYAKCEQVSEAPTPGLREDIALNADGTRPESPPGDHMPTSDTTARESRSSQGLVPIPCSKQEPTITDTATQDDATQKDEKDKNTQMCSERESDVEEQAPRSNPLDQAPALPTTLVSLTADASRWSQETFPTATAVLTHLPFALVPFALSMFVLVQALVTKGWVPLFAYGWDHWVDRTGTLGSLGGMAFLSAILCNFAGTNIGTTILLSRVIQSWQAIHRTAGAPPIPDRTFWAAVYGMALGVNYGAFSLAFSASLAGLLWRDILGRKHVRVRRRDFALVNLPLITVAMAVGCAVLAGEVYLTRGTAPYTGGGS